MVDRVAEPVSSSAPRGGGGLGRRVDAAVVARWRLVAVPSAAKIAGRGASSNQSEAQSPTAIEGTVRNCAHYGVFCGNDQSFCASPPAPARAWACLHRRRSLSYAVEVEGGWCCSRSSKPLVPWGSLGRWVRFLRTSAIPVRLLLCLQTRFRAVWSACCCWPLRSSPAAKKARRARNPPQP